MGEALITRRGGSVMSGKVRNLATSYNSNTISDPALIGAKEAMIFATFTGSLSDATNANASYLSFRITNGEIAKLSYLFGGEVTEIVNENHCSFDIATGTITRKAEGSAVYFWGKIDSTSKAIPYEYIVF